MRVHAIIEADLTSAAASARIAEQLGFDGVWTTETDHDPFLPLVLAAEATTDLRVGTAIAVALARSPWTLAQLAHDLQRYSGGRFVLGLGSQVKAHIERRFSAPWDRPASRLRELILAVRSLWASWQRGDRLDFKGEFYTHTLMPPLFDPGPSGQPDPPIVLAALGTGMTEIAGEVADGVLAHGFTTPSYVRDVVVPAVARGAARAGRDPRDVEILRPVFVVTGGTDEEMAQNAATVRNRLAFYGSTADYRPVLDHHGWGDLQPELAQLARQKEWERMADLVGDEMLAEFAVVAPLDELATAVRDRYEGVVDRISFRLPANHHDAWAQVIADLKG